MKYKVLKGCPLYEELLALRRRINKVADAANAVAVKWGARQAATTFGNGFGEISAFYFPNGHPGKNWRAADRKSSQFFMPRSVKEFKENKPIFEDIAGLQVITFDEVNAVVGFAEYFGSAPGYRGDGVGLAHYRTYSLEAIDTLDFALIEIPGAPAGKPYEPKEGMTEILESEYNRLMAVVKEERKKLEEV